LTCGGFLIFILNTSTELPMKHNSIQPKLHQALVMPARVGKCVGAVRCQSGWVASHVRGMWVALRGSGLQIVALAMRHNDLLSDT